MLQRHSRPTLRETVAHKTSRPDRLWGQGGNPEAPVTKPAKLSQTARCKARRYGQDPRETDDEPGAVFGEVETRSNRSSDALVTSDATKRHADLFAGEANAALISQTN